MPVLNWIGKDAVVRHDAEVPVRLLHDVPELACGDAESGNLIVEGDNLLALKALLPHYGGRVKCIYMLNLLKSLDACFRWNDGPMAFWLKEVPLHSVPRHPGSVSATLKPPSGRLLRLMLPPCASAISRASARPRPVPLRLVE